MSPDWRRPGTSHEQIAEGRSSWWKRIKDAREAVAAVAIAIPILLGGVRLVVQQVFREELTRALQAANEAKLVAEDARAKASGVAVMRSDFDAHVLEHLGKTAEIKAELGRLGSVDMSLHQADTELQRRMDVVLVRGGR
jgi:hypothetical protein